MTEKILKLNLKKKWYDLMCAGHKNKEFRPCSKWIESRLVNKDYKLVKFTNGYRSDSPYFYVEYKGYEISPEDKEYKFNNEVVYCKKGSYIINLGNVVEMS